MWGADMDLRILIDFVKTLIFQIYPSQILIVQIAPEVTLKIQTEYTKVLKI